MSYIYPRFIFTSVKFLQHKSESQIFITICVKSESITLLNYENNIFMAIIDKELWDSKCAIPGKNFLPASFNPLQPSAPFLYYLEKDFLMVSGGIKMEHWMVMG